MGIVDSYKISAVKKLIYTVVIALFVFSSVSIAAKEARQKVTSSRTTTITPLGLHAAPNCPVQAQGLRETSPEEVQRVEQLGGCHNLSRNNSISQFIWAIYPYYLTYNHLHKPLLRVESARLNANLIALAHTNLAARYPIPPPQISL